MTRKNVEVCCSVKQEEVHSCPAAADSCLADGPGANYALVLLCVHPSLKSHFWLVPMPS